MTKLVKSVNSHTIYPPEKKLMNIPSASMKSREEQKLSDVCKSTLLGLKNYIVSDKAHNQVFSQSPGQSTFFFSDV